MDQLLDLLFFLLGQWWAAVLIIVPMVSKVSAEVRGWSAELRGWSTDYREWRRYLDEKKGKEQ